MYEWLGIRTERQIKEEIDEAEEELTRLEDSLNEALDDDLTDEERLDIIDSYKVDIEEVTERIMDLNTELEEL